MSSFVDVSQPWMLGFLVLGGILISVFWRYKKLAVVGFCFLFFVLGIWRHQIAESEIIYPEEQDITLVGTVITEPDIRSNNIKLTIKQFENGSRRFGKVLVTTNRYPEYQYGDRLKIRGNLLAPPQFEGFNYKNYLLKDGIFAVMSWPEIELIGQGFGNPIMSSLFAFKNKFQEIAKKFIPPPQIGILEALFSGDEGNISKEWKDKFNMTGTRHITAVSGMNITIIGFLIMSFAMSCGLWRKQAIYLSVFLLIFYILMIGAPASAVRAGIMAVILMAAQYFGRLSSASRAVLFAAAVMLAKNPLLLRLDVGFQLSFLAIFGLIYLQPILFNWLKKIPNWKMFPVRTTFSATLSAQFFTLPILVYNFGYIPLLSPITNFLIVPLLAPITILIFIFGILGMIFWPLGFLFSLPTWLSLTYIISVIDWFSKLPFASLRFENIHWAWLVIFYLILGIIARQINKKGRFSSAFR